MKKAEITKDNKLIIPMLSQEEPYTVEDYYDTLPPIENCRYCNDESRTLFEGCCPECYRKHCR